jgi:hypothetical protein
MPASSPQPPPSSEAQPAVRHGPAPAPAANLPAHAASAAQPAKANGAHPAQAETFDPLLGSEIDAGFASLERTTSAQFFAPVATDADYDEVRKLFAQLAANHVRPVRDFMMDLRWSDATVDWLPICEPALRSLRGGADKLDLTALGTALDRFSGALEAAHASEDRVLAGDLRSTILAAYEDLAREMPEAFALELDRSQREGAILQSLLLQVQDVKKITLDKVYAAGLTTLDAFRLATAADIAATTGIAEVVAGRIVERFRAYHEQVKATAPDASRARDYAHIAALAERLEGEHEGYERAGQDWSKDAAEKKKQYRKARSQTMLDIQVALARLGEGELLARLERLPFEGKLSELDSFLEEARDAKRDAKQDAKQEDFLAEL